MGVASPPSLELFYDFDGEEIATMANGSGLAEAMLGLGVRLTGGSEVKDEVRSS